MMKILVINGPNLNMLGIREPAIYGKEDYEHLVRMIKEHAGELSVEVECFQSNHEGELVDRIQQAYFDETDGIVINPGAYTHTSVAILDAAKCVSIPLVEVHISDLSQREEFRQVSYIRQAAVKTIVGEGLQGYLSAMDFLTEYISRNR